MNEELVFEMCLKSESKNPIEIVQTMMDLEECRIHGPEHHLLVGSALLTAYKNAGGDLDLSEALKELQNRSKNVPGGACGFWGACGAGISSGMYMSIITKSSPMENKPFGLSNLMTSKSLGAIGSVGGPRCCKRDSFLSILSAVDFVRENLGVEMEKTVPACKYSGKNEQCIGERCPFNKNKRSEEIMTKWEKAVELFSKGFMCSSAVFGAYADEIGINFETAVKVATPFNSGMRKAEVCGAVTGALMVIGAKFGQKSVDESRVLVNKLTENFLDEFAKENGSYMCCDLLKCDISMAEGAACAKENNLFITVCPKMVESAVKVLEKVLGEI